MTSSLREIRMNAIEVDRMGTDVQSVLILAGQNELHRRMSNQDSQRNEERLEKLASSVTILAPPPQNFYNPEAHVKEEMLVASREKLALSGV